MPLILKKTTRQDITLGLWELIEDEAFFDERLDLTSAEVSQLEEIKGGRRLHWLCSRYLLHILTSDGTRLNCVKDEFGKPQLMDSPLEISFSHSDRLVAVALASKPVGIDIQIRVDRITRIRHKFVNEKEDHFVEEDEVGHAHVIWGAKESAFKAYGRKQVDFKSHLTFLPHGRGQFGLKLHKPLEKIEYSGKYEQWGDYTLVYLKENSTSA